MPRLLPLFLILLTSCAATPTTKQTHSPSNPQSAIHNPQSPTPYLLHLPGISGPLPIDHALATGLSQSHLPTPLIFDWTAHDPGLHALTAYPRNQQQAQLLATQLTDQYRAHPTTPILITAHSGGTGIAIWALEKCPPDVKIQTLLLLESALSPTYDLSPALSHVTHHAYAFSSPFDNIVLGTGTSTLGTIDRVYTQAAGMVGFQTPAHPKLPNQYQKLTPMPYDPAWMSLGNHGDHIGPMSRTFAAQILSPLLGGTPPPLKPIAGTQRVPGPTPATRP